MDSFWVNLAITTILSALKEAFKNSTKKEGLKKAMLKIAGTIQAVYGDDAGFDADLKTAVDKAKASA